MAAASGSDISAKLALEVPASISGENSSPPPFIFIQSREGGIIAAYEVHTYVENRNLTRPLQHGETTWILTHIWREASFPFSIVPFVTGIGGKNAKARSVQTLLTDVGTIRRESVRTKEKNAVESKKRKEQQTMIDMILRGREDPRIKVSW